MIERALLAEGAVLLVATAERAVLLVATAEGAVLLVATAEGAVYADRESRIIHLARNRS